jgi:two-component system chemotaxis response regulator CheY
MVSKILIVDDSLLARRQAVQALSTAGFTVVQAIDGVEALQQISQHPEIRVVVTDIHMRRMDGFDLLESVRRSDATQKLSFIILTSETQRDLMHRAKSLGAKGWIVKPFKPDLLIAAVRRVSNQLDV